MRAALLLLAAAKELRRDEKAGLRLGHEFHRADLQQLRERSDEERLAGRGKRLQAHCGLDFAALPEMTGAAGEWGVHAAGGQWALAQLGETTDPVVTGSFAEDSKTEGWSQARVSFKPSSSDSRLPDGQKMFAAGFLEGAVTAERIGQFYSNTAYSDADRVQMNEVFDAQLEKMSDKIGSESTWHAHAVGAACQMAGMAQGYNARRAQLGGSFVELGTPDIMGLNADGQKDELLALRRLGMLDSAKEKLDEVDAEALGGALEPRHAQVRPASATGPSGAREALLETALTEEAAKPGRCSALIRFTGDDLFVGHATWEDYSEQVRYWKLYDFPLEGAKAAKLSFSAYPGTISSTDDFIQTDQSLIATETTTNTRKAEAMPRFKKEAHYPDYVNMLGAARNSGSAEELAHHFIYNADELTGTYTSQWLIVDYNKANQALEANKASLLEGASAKAALPEGTAYVVETGPGVAQADAHAQLLEVDGGKDALFEVKKLRVDGEEDPAQVLVTPHGSAVILDASAHISKTGFWGSENEPATDPMKEIQGYSYDPRKDLFAKYAPKVHTFRDMLALMRHNDKDDDGVDWNQGIAARADLVGPLFGATDMKGVSQSLMQNMEVVAIAGPTATLGADGAAECSPFVWSPEQLQGVQGIGREMFFDFYKMTEKGSAKFADGCFNAKTPRGATNGPSLLETFS